MLLASYLLLGIAASRAFRFPGLLLVVSILAVAIGVEGALSHRAFAPVLLDAVLMLAAIECTYVVASMLWRSEAWPFFSRKA